MKAGRIIRKMGALALCALMITGTFATAYADTTAYTKGKVAIYVDHNGTPKKAGTEKAGVAVTVKDVKGAWALVEKDGKQAYMKASDLTTSAPKSATSDASSVTKCNKAVYVASSNAKVYKSASTGATVLDTPAAGKKLTMKAYDDTWCQVKNGSATGYMLRSDLSLTKVTAEATPKPETTKAPDSDAGSVTKCNKAVYVSSSSAKVYKSASTGAQVLDTPAVGKKLTMKAYDDTWCQVKNGSATGYMLRSDLSLTKVTAEATPEAEATKSPDAGASVTTCNKAVYVAKDGAAVYDAAGTSAKVIDHPAMGEKLTMKAYDDTWCMVKNGSATGYMLRSDLSLTKVSADEQTGVTQCSKTAYAVEDGVKVYARAATSSDALATLSKNDAVRVSAYTDDWCQVKNGSHTGYVRRSDLSDEKVSVLPKSLGYGDTGDAVKLLQQRLKDLGYFTGSVEGNYLAQTRDAVKLFQSQNGLTADGAAGEKTLEKLFDKSAAKYDPSKVEKQEEQEPTGESTASPASGKSVEMDWWTSNIQQIFARGVTAVITDVETGISWKERRNGGTNHADCQPLTAADTAAMKKAAGGKWSWNRRAIWVSIGGQKYAASMNCMPHGSGSITTNNFGGHHCIHFTNSRTHGSNKVCPLHQAAIKKALAAG